MVLSWSSKFLFHREKGGEGGREKEREWERKREWGYWSDCATNDDITVYIHNAIWYADDDDDDEERIDSEFHEFISWSYY